MKKRDGESLRERSATCKTCGLTAHNQHELDDHISYAHRVRGIEMPLTLVL